MQKCSEAKVQIFAVGCGGGKGKKDPSIKLLKEKHRFMKYEFEYSNKLNVHKLLTCD